MNSQPLQMETLLLSSQAAGVGEGGTEILGSWSLDPGCNRAAAGALEARPLSQGVCAVKVKCTLASKDSVWGKKLQNIS